MKNTLISVWRIACFAGILALTGCAATPVFEPYSHKEIKHPAPLTTSTVAKGQLVYLHYDYDSLIVYHLQEPLNMSFMVFGKIIVSDQEILYRGILERKEVLCTKSNTFYDMLGNAVHTSCFVDNGRAGKVDTVMTASDTTWFERPMNRTITYRVPLKINFYCANLFNFQLFAGNFQLIFSFDQIG